MIAKCCVCGMIIGKHEKNGPEEEITHTYCDNCLKVLIDRNHEEDDVAAIIINNNNRG